MPAATMSARRIIVDAVWRTRRPVASIAERELGVLAHAIGRPRRRERHLAGHRVDAVELGLDFVELGLIYGVDIDGGHVHVTFTLTSPGCPIGPQVAEQIDEFVSELYILNRILDPKDNTLDEDMIEVLMTHRVQGTGAPVPKKAGKPESDQVFEWIDSMDRT